MLYLSQAIGRPVRDRQGEPIGKVADLIVAIGGKYPPVTGLVVSTGRRRIFLPWSDVASFDASGAALGTHMLDINKFTQRPNELLLYADLQDKQIVDIDGRKVVRVNDLRLDDIEGRLHLVAVDVGPGRHRAAARRRGAVPDGGAQPPPAQPRSATSTGRTSTRSRPPSRRSACGCPTRASASCTRRTWPRSSTSWRRATGPASWPPWTTRQAADAIEEMEPDTQVEVLEDLPPERAADILEEMSPDDAADLVADLSEAARAEILPLMERTRRRRSRRCSATPRTRPAAS